MMTLLNNSCLTKNNIHLGNGLMIIYHVFLQGKNMLVIGTTSEVDFLESLGICDAFSVTYHVPTLDKKDAKKVKLV